MITAFNSIYTALQGFLSRGFWFAVFLPVTLFAIVHATLAVFVTGPLHIFGIAISLQEKIDAASLASVAPAIVLALVVASYALMPFVPRLRGLLDGSLLPTRLHDWLRQCREADARPILDALRQARDDVGALREMTRDLSWPEGRLQRAYRKGRALKEATAAGGFEQSRQTMGVLEEACRDGLPLAKAADRAMTAVVGLLERSNPSPEALRELRGDDHPTEEELGRSAETNEIADLLEERLTQAGREAEYRYQAARSRTRIAPALEYPRATAVGDARFVVERYAYDVYQVDFDFLWPRLLVAMRADKAEDPALQAIEAARCQVDFAVLSFFLTATIPLVWMPGIVATGGSPWLFLVVGLGTPLFLRFFYDLVFEGQLAFGDLVKTAIDKYRLLVLRMLHMPQPLSRSQERYLWSSLMKAEEQHWLAEILYEAGKTGEK